MELVKVKPDAAEVLEVIWFFLIGVRRKCW